MKNIILASVCFVLIFCNCASIVSKSTYPISIQTIPPGAKINVTDGKGEIMYSGLSPATVPLKASEGFFKKAHYTVTASQEGYANSIMPIPFKVDGWYFGNLLLGGVIGMLIIDPATGAMFAPEKDGIVIQMNK